MIYAYIDVFIDTSEEFAEKDFMEHFSVSHVQCVSPSVGFTLVLSQFTVL